MLGTYFARTLSHFHCHTKLLFSLSTTTTTTRARSRTISTSLMLARGKRKDDDNHASDGGDSDGSAPPKKSAKQDDEDGIVVCEISKNRRVSVREWQGRVFVDIREFYVKDGKQMPGKKGISLTMDQWKVLREHVEEIDQAVSENS